MTAGRRPVHARFVVALAVAAAFGLAHGPPAAGRVAVGAFVPGAAQDPSLIDAYAQKAGRKPVIVSWYREWKQQAFVSRTLDAIALRGAIPMITWEPYKAASWNRYDPGKGTYYPPRSIAAGKYDRYIRASALDAKRWGRPIFVRFAHEMNGAWYPWGAGVNGNTAADYKNAWRHVVKTFRSVGAQKVRWVWGPNTDDDGELPFKRFYPGDRWVDWVGLSGFNWGGPWEWQSAAAIYGHSYRAILQLTAKPIVIAEMAAGERGGNKAKWIKRTFGRDLPTFKHIRAVVWFNGQDRWANWDIDSSVASLAAFRSAIAAPNYGASPKDVLQSR
jgi:glycosyl hydrolase family 26